MTDTFSLFDSGEDQIQDTSAEVTNSPATTKRVTQNSFTHLHVHTEYSILDGASRVDDLIDVAVADGQPALGITDHGNMYGVLDFYRKCKNAGIKPIIGTEAYMAKDSRYERPARKGRADDSGGSTESGEKVNYHLTLLAADNAGYKNLIQISSRAFLEGFYYKPRCDWETLNDHSKGLIATTGCLGGQVPQALLAGDETEALKRAGRLQDIFGKDNFFVEMQDHGIAEQELIKPLLLQVAHKLGAPLLATNDSHYTHRADAGAHDALLCVQTASRIDDEKRFRFKDDQQHYLKSAAEMRYLFREMEEACDNTLLIAERADVNIEFGKPLLPYFPIPDKYENARDYLQYLTLKGAKQRWGSPLPEKVSDRLVDELDVITNMGFDSYFLITWDLVAYAKQRGIRVGPGRGSAAGCAVAYALEITDLDPIRYDLLFERFLNPGRLSMPDIDIDFDSRFREEIINYAAERYGRDHVAQIITFGKIGARQGVRDAARVLGYPPSLGDKISKLIPPLIAGRDTPLRHCLTLNPAHQQGFLAATDLRNLIDTDKDAAKVVEVAKGLEGLRRQDSIHAAAMVITPEPVTEYMPIQRKPPKQGGDIETSPIVTQYDMHGVESLGLLKMDILGLRNLDVISDCLKLIQKNHGIALDIDDVDLEDEQTFDLLRDGDTIGVFQLESPQMRALMQSLAPSTFDDVAALVALYRPGPMADNMHNDYAERKNGRQEVTYFHEDAKEILGDTYGLMIYQENVMRVAQRFAGYSLADADTLRKAMGKKIPAVMAKERTKFVSGVTNSGYSKSLAESLFQTVEKFAGYAFNKSHSYGYGLIAYQTAYLKANYPVEFFAAVLSSLRHNSESAAKYLAECRQQGIRVAVPDINRSDTDFCTEQEKILYGLSAIRHVGEGFAESIINEREANGQYESFVDFLERVDLTLTAKNKMLSLIRGGAFDSLGHTRKGLAESYKPLMAAVSARRKQRESGVISLFDTPDTSVGNSSSFEELPPIGETENDRITLLSQEKKVLGLYLSGHPLEGNQEQLKSLTDKTLADIPGTADGGFVSVGGVITRYKTRRTARGELMANFDLEDEHDTAHVVIFPRVLAAQQQKLADGMIVLVTGRVQDHEGSPNLLASKVDVLDTDPETDTPDSEPEAVGTSDINTKGEAKVYRTPRLRIRLNTEHQTDNKIDTLREIITSYAGNTLVELVLPQQRVMYKLPQEYAVVADSGILQEIESALGKNSAAFV